MQQAKRWTALAVLALAALLVGDGATADAQDDKNPTIKEIMGKAHKGNTALVAVIGKQLQAAKPEWDTIQPQTKELAELGTALGKNSPPKGNKQSWERLTKAYNTNAAALVTAADAKDKRKAVAAHQKLVASCMGCHTAHRPR
jgi:hypothetical protein